MDDIFGKINNKKNLGIQFFFITTDMTCYDYCIFN